MSKQTSEISCECGEMVWIIKDTSKGRHLACHCIDCQSFARHLNQADRHLEKDGTRIFQTYPGNVEFVKGAEHLALLQLSPKGTYRWYAKCCNTPIANTMTKSALPFSGMILPKDHPDFGAIKSRFFTKYTEEDVKDKAVLPAILSFLSRGAIVRLKGQERKSPFFMADDQPVATSTVLTKEQRNQARAR